MFKDIILTLKLRLTYKLNAIIHSFRTIPVIGKEISYSTYGYYDVKNFLFKIIFAIYLLGFPFLFFLFSIFIYGICGGSIADNKLTFPMVFIVCTILMNIVMPFTFRADRDSDYAINSLQMPAKRYLLNNYLYKTVLQLFGLFIGLFLVHRISLNTDSALVPLTYVFAFPILYVSLRTITAYVNLTLIKKKILYFLYYFVLLLLGTLLVYVYNYHTDLTLKLCNVYVDVFIALGFISFIRVLLFKNYHKVFKYLFNKKLAKKSLKEADIERISNAIDNSTNIKSNKHGYDLLHELFVKRHSKILMKPIVGYTIIEALLVVAALIAVNTMSGAKDTISKIYSEYSLYFLVVMYFINRGERLTKAMFMNCDHAMLTYRVYRNPKVILEMFKRRLKTLIGLNLIPAMVLSIGSLILLIISKASTTSIILFPLSLLLISVFFSVHNLVLYYLLQPYNSGTEERSKSYRIARTVTYIVAVYPAMYFNVTISPEIFSILCLGVSVVYIIVALFVINKYASKTFKLYY